MLGARLQVPVLEERLSAVLAAPPDWSQRLPFYCDALRISAVDLRVSSRLDVELGSSSGRVDLAAGSIPLVSHLLQLMIVFVKGIGTNLANISKVPFHFDAFEQDFPLCTKSELFYKLLQSFSWQAAAQLGKLLGHSEMLGNPFGVIQGMGSGVAGAVRGVGMGIVRRDGEQIVRGGQQLMGSVVGGAAGLGARLTGSLHSIVEKLTSAIAAINAQVDGGGVAPLALQYGAGASMVLVQAQADGGRDGRRNTNSLDMNISYRGDGGALIDVKRGLQLNFKDGFKEGGKHALRMLANGLAGLLLRPLDGFRRDGIDGLARGAATGTINCLLLPLAAALETGAVVLHSLEQVRREEGARWTGHRPLASRTPKLRGAPC